ncbi:hypothetical protein MBLNU459_g7720t1 [Dothideomycetes sp. NU459]
MLLSSFSSARRLLILGVLVFFTIVILVRNSNYSAYLPNGIPALKSNGAAGEQQQQQQQHQSSPPPPPDAAAATPPAMWQEYKPAQDANKIDKVDPLADSPEEFHQEEPAKVAPPPPPTTSLPPPPPADGGSSAPRPTGPAPAKVQGGEQATYAEIQRNISKFIHSWTRPNDPGHWPSFDGYIEKNYDPNRWEGLPWDSDMFVNNGVDKLLDAGTPLKPYFPYPSYHNETYKQQWQGEFVACDGPRGLPLNESLDDAVMAYHGLPADFPNVTVGSAEAVGIDTHVCFDRHSRYGPYGSYSPDAGSRPNLRPDWARVFWGQLQDQCLQRNQLRYHPDVRAPMIVKPTRVLPKDHDRLDERAAAPAADDAKSDSTATPTDTPSYHSRTAVVIRTWEGYSYTDNDLQAIRALVSELSLLSGGEYQVYLLVNVKQREADIYDNPDVYQDILKKVVPPELRDISVLWTEQVMEEWYPKVGDWQVYWMQFMPLQWFSKTHPEFDYIWNWETDARYTGNHYHFLEQIAAFSKSMPRKHLWERSSRFYFPSKHGSYEEFLADTDAAIDRAQAEGTMTPVWGAQPYATTQIPIGPQPPTGEDYDQYQWGVDEEADLITLQPIWDPNETEWSYRHKIWNFIPGVRPVFTAKNGAALGFYHEGFENIQRRVFINTVARFSRKMLHAMHMENINGRSMQAEMWPATVALHHGLKAVYAPHPIWADRKWPAWYLDAIFNTDGGKTARWGQQIDSPYNHDREANFRGWSWYYASGFPSVIYRRWLGWKAKDGSALGDAGGVEFEIHGLLTADGTTVGGHGRLCLPGMLLHPVKKVKKDP